MLSKLTNAWHPLRHHRRPHLRPLHHAGRRALAPLPHLRTSRTAVRSWPVSPLLTLKQRLHEILADDIGSIPPRLQPIHDALAGTERAGTTMRWLSKRIVSTVLSDLGSGRRHLTHEALDELPEGEVVEHIRWATARRLLHDDTLKSEDRFAACCCSSAPSGPPRSRGSPSTTSRRRTEPSASASAPSRSSFPHPLLNWPSTGRGSPQPCRPRPDRLCLAVPRRPDRPPDQRLGHGRTAPRMTSGLPRVSTTVRTCRAPCASRGPDGEGGPRSRAHRQSAPVETGPPSRLPRRPARRRSRLAADRTSPACAPPARGGARPGDQLDPVGRDTGGFVGVFFQPFLCCLYLARVLAVLDVVAAVRRDDCHGWPLLRHVLLINPRFSSAAAVWMAFGGEPRSQKHRDLSQHRGLPLRQRALHGPGLGSVQGGASR